MALTEADIFHGHRLDHLRVAPMITTNFRGAIWDQITISRRGSDGRAHWIWSGEMRSGRATHVIPLRMHRGDVIEPEIVIDVARWIFEHCEGYSLAPKDLVGRTCRAVRCVSALHRVVQAAREVDARAAPDEPVRMGLGVAVNPLARAVRTNP